MNIPSFNKHTAERHLENCCGEVPTEDLMVHHAIGLLEIMERTGMNPYEACGILQMFAHFIERIQEGTYDEDFPPYQELELVHIDPHDILTAVANGKATPEDFRALSPDSIEGPFAVRLVNEDAFGQCKL